MPQYRLLTKDSRIVGYSNDKGHPFAPEIGYRLQATEDIYVEGKLYLKEGDLGGYADRLDCIGENAAIMKDSIIFGRNVEIKNSVLQGSIIRGEEVPKGKPVVLSGSYVVDSYVRNSSIIESSIQNVVLDGCDFSDSEVKPASGQTGPGIEATFNDVKVSGSTFYVMNLEENRIASFIIGGSYMNSWIALFSSTLEIPVRRQIAFQPHSLANNLNTNLLSYSIGSNEKVVDGANIIAVDAAVCLDQSNPKGCDFSKIAKAGKYEIDDPAGLTAVGFVRLVEKETRIPWTSENTNKSMRDIIDCFEIFRKRITKNSTR